MAQDFLGQDLPDAGQKYSTISLVGVSASLASTLKERCLPSPLSLVSWFGMMFSGLQEIANSITIQRRREEDLLCCSSCWATQSYAQDMGPGLKGNFAVTLLQI